jgi:hypothetical protein
MKEKLRFWGLDVHAETIAVAIAKSSSPRRYGDSGRSSRQ